MGTMVFFEWLFAIILFFLGLGSYDTTANYWDYTDSEYDIALAMVYFVGALVVGIFAIVHTKEVDDYEYGDRRYSSTTTNNWYNSSYTPNRTTTRTTTTTYVTYKTTQEVVKDITSNYPTPSTVISQITEHKIKKKTSIFPFKKETQVTTEVITPCTESRKEADLIMFDKNEERDIINALNHALQEYVCYEDIQEIKPNIIHAEFDDDYNINVFFEPSKRVNIYGTLNRACITESMKKYLGYCEVIRFVETKEKFEDFYTEWKKTRAM